jgi:hypothetical protein
VHFPAFRQTILTELSRRDERRDLDMQVAWKEELMTLFEQYLGSQRVSFSYSPAIGGSSASRVAITPEILRSNISHLKSRYQFALLEDGIYPVAGLKADSEITSKIQDWWTAEGTEILWVQTPPLHNERRSLASDMVALSRAVNFPVAAYFCQRLNANSGTLSQLDILIDLVYSLIYQICMSMTEDITSHVDLSASRFSALDGTIRSFTQALDLIRNLLSLKHGGQLLLIDGMDILDYGDDLGLRGYLKMLFEILRNSEFNGAVKTIIITEGHSGMILDEVGWENTVDASLSDSSEGFLSIDNFEAGFERTSGTESGRSAIPERL